MDDFEQSVDSRNTFYQNAMIHFKENENAFIKNFSYLCYKARETLSLSNFTEPLACDSWLYTKV